MRSIERLYSATRLLRAAQRDLALAANDGQRRAQLVADIGEEAAARLVDLPQGLVRLAQLLGALLDQALEIGVRILQGLLVRLQISGHAIEALAEIGKLVAAGNGDAMRKIALGELARCRASARQAASASRCNRSSTSASVARMASAAWIWLIRSSRAKSRCRVGIDPDHFGGLVGDADLDQLVQLLVDAALQQIDQPLPGDVGAAAAPQLLDLVELVESVLELRSDLLEALQLGGIPPFAPRA